MEELIKSLLKANADPKLVVVGILASFSKGSLEKRKIAANYIRRWGGYVNDDRLIYDLWKMGFIQKPEKNIEDCVFIEKYSVQSRDEGMAMAEELWDAYPAVLPLSGGGSFLARKGDDKHEILKMYLDRIQNDSAKHQHVLRQLHKFIKAVYAKQVNGVRIQEFISNEIWDLVDEIDSNGNFKTDI